MCASAFSNRWGSLRSESAAWIAMACRPMTVSSAGCRAAAATFSALLDHFQTALALLTEAEMIGVRQEDREIGPFRRGKGLLKDRFEILLDRVAELGETGAWNRAGVRGEVREGFLRPFQDQTELDDPGCCRARIRREYAGLIAERPDTVGERDRVGRRLHVEGSKLDQGHPVEWTGVAG